MTAPAINHVGLNVPDLKQATRFLVEALGCTELFTTPPEALSVEEAANLNVSAGTLLGGITVLKAGNALIELFEYHPPGGIAPTPGNHGTGAAHLAFDVPDVDAALARVAAAGGCACGPVSDAASPGFEGLRWVYVLSPWGQTFELVDTRAAPLLRNGGQG